MPAYIDDERQTEYWDGRAEEQHVMSASVPSTERQIDSIINVKRVDHFSYTVGDIDRSVQFYAQFGYEPVNRYAEAGPQLDRGRQRRTRRHGYPAAAPTRDGPMLELIRYTQYQPTQGPRGTRGRRRAHGVCRRRHAAAYAALKADGVEFLSEPNIDQYGEHVGVYARPDGIPVELMQPGRPGSERPSPTPRG